MINWISLYDWALSETTPEDRPDPEVVADDRLFDGWLERMERKAAQLASKARSNQAKAQLNG